VSLLSLLPNFTNVYGTCKSLGIFLLRFNADVSLIEVSIQSRSPPKIVCSSSHLVDRSRVRSVSSIHRIVNSWRRCVGFERVR
jgi:hypothetical protein